MSDDTSRKYYYAFFAAALTALVVPLWLVELPPLVDLPNHLARVFILANYAETPFFQRNFEIAREPFPNLAIDLIVAPLVGWFDIFTANHLFLTLTVVLFAVGCHLLGARKRGERSFSAIPAMFLVYGGTFFYGYVNYVFAVALFLVTFALWLRWRDNFDALRFAALVVLAFAVYLSHLSAVGFLGIAIFFARAYDFFVSAEEKRKWTLFFADGALFVLPAIAFLAFINGTGHVGALRWNSFTGKAVALFGPFRSYDLAFDLICVGLLAVFLFSLGRFGKTVFDSRFLALALFFFALFTLAPNTFFTGDADVRIILPAFALLIISCKVNFLNGKTFALFALLIGSLLLRQSAISYRWTQMSERLTAEALLLDAIAPESKIFPIFVNDSTGAEEKFERPLLNAAHFAAFRNRSFAATLFAVRGQTLLNFRGDIEFATLENADATKWIRYLDDYDYVWTRGAPPGVSNELERRAVKVADNGKTKIWKLNK